MYNTHNVIMGLESLIPNKNSQQQPQQNSGGGFSQDRDEVDEIDIEETRYTVRRERDDLGVLSSLLAGTSHPQREQSPFQERQSPYATPQQEARNIEHETWNVSQHPAHNIQYTTPDTRQQTYQEPQRPLHPAQNIEQKTVEDKRYIRQEYEQPPEPKEFVEREIPVISKPREHQRESFIPAKPRERHETPVLSGPIFQVEVGKIFENPYQPRKEFDEGALNELASSIREFGVIQPLLVTRMNEETEDGLRTTYQLIAGHRRLLASKKVGLKTVPVVIRNQLKRADALEMAIVENVQREDLNIVETARAYARLSDEFGLTQREIAARLGKSRESIANTVRLLSLPTHIQDAISAGKINESHARILMQIQDPTQQEKIFDQIVSEGLSVRDTKRTVAHTISSLHAPRHAQDPQLKSLERDISDVVGAPVHIELSEKGGKIIIHFFSPEEAEGIAQRIRKEQQY